MKKNIQLKLIFQLAIKPYIHKVIILVILMITSSASTVFIPLLQQSMVDNGLLVNDLRHVAGVLAIIILLIIINTIFEIVQSYLQMEINLDVTKNLEVDAMNHALKLKVTYINQKGLYKLVKDADNYIQGFSDITGVETIRIITELFKFIGVLIGLFLISWKMTFFVLGLMPLRLVLMIFTNKVMSKASNDSFSVQKQLHRWEDDVYSSFSHIKLWNLIVRRINEYTQLLSGRNKAVQKMNVTMSASNVFGTSIQQIIMYLLYLVCGFYIIRGEMSIGALFTFITYAAYVIQPIELVSYLAMTLAKLEPLYENYLEFKNMEEETELGVKFTDAEKLQIRFNNVSFGYDKHPILNAVNVCINTGDVIAIVGENGTGKTTFIELLLRLYVPDDGKITLNGEDIQNIQLQEYRENLTLVSQNTYLFKGTIKDNYTVYGRYNDQDHMLDMPLFRFIKEFKDGVNKQIGSQSSQLSGGEKQKISLLRAISKNSRIMILDEPTSSYDQISERDFEDILLKAKRDIVILITHNPDQIRFANKVLYVTNGTVNLKENTNEGEDI